MAIDTTSTSSAPYHDDWSPAGNSAKNYLKILFQPGRSVQVRELNQMQSGIQAQIDKFGQHVFKEGARVVDGEIDIDNKIQWVDLTLNDAGANAAGDSTRPLIGKTLFADTSLTTYTGNETSIDVAATIMDYELKSGNEYRFYIRYASSTNDFNNSVRTQADVRLGEAASTHVSAGGVIGNGSATLTTGYALKLHCNKGVYFVKGYFVEVAEQTKYVDQNSTTGPKNTIDGKVGFTITESIKTAVNDNTLYDNAQGTSNHQAPGADRYTIVLTLALITDDSTVDSIPAHVVPSTTSNTVDVVPVVQSEVTEPVETKYNLLGDTLAKRTSEESGDYSLQPFTLDLREHLDNTINRGKFLAADGGDRDKFVATLEPSIAYVKGYRCEVLKKQEIIVEKAIDTEIETDLQVQARQGSYIELDSIVHMPNPNANAASGQETYTIKDNSGNTDGTEIIATCRCRGIEKIGRKFRFYVSPVSTGRDLTMATGKKLSEGVTITGDAIDNSSTFIGTSNTGMILKEVGNGSLLFRVPADVVKTLDPDGGNTNKVNIPVIETRTSGVAMTSGHKLALPTLSSGEKYYKDNPSEYIVIKVSDGSVIPVDSVSITNSGADCELDCTTAAPGALTSTNVHVMFGKRKSAVKNVKALATSTNEVGLVGVGGSASTSTSDFKAGDIVGLGQKDVIAASSITNTVGGADVSSHFIVKSGQTDVGYDNGFLICVKDIDNCQVVVTYDYFDHTTTGNDAFWVDSYTNLETSLPRTDVGFYKNVNLTDALDFRGTNTILDPNGIIEFEKVQYYLPRFDRIVIRSTGEISYLKGNAFEGSVPEIPGDSMLLYDLNVPAYTDSVQQIEIGYEDNRRYTMRDIGKIERRVKNLEYYSSLSLLEKMTKDQKILDDATQADRFKNGIIVDEFKGHGIGNPRDPGYKCATEPERGILRPSFTSTNLPIRLGGTDGTGNTANDKSQSVNSSGVAEVIDDANPIGAHDYARLPSTSIRTLIDQPFASVSVSVNPFDVASWVGEIRISPETDEWKDTNRRPEVIITQDGNADAMLAIANASLAQGTRWNDWQTTWSGVTQTENLGMKSINETAQLVPGTTIHRMRRRRRWWRRSRWIRVGIDIPTFGGGTFSPHRVNRISGIELESRTTTTEQIRSGIQQFAKIETIQESLGDRVVDVSFVPFIRSRKLYFRATGLKPNTTVIPFFDGVNVSGYVKTATFKEYRDEDTFEDHSNDSPGNISEDVLTTNKAGMVQGYLIIPNSDKLRFRTGEREFLLVANEGGLGSFTADDLLKTTTTFAKTTYTAKGIVQTVEERILSTRRIAIDERRVTDSRTLTSTEIAATGRVRHRDPVAQTFVVDPDLHSQGVFLHDVEVFFSKIHSDLPVHFHIVTAENGIPTQKIVPHSEVTRYPSRQHAVDAGAVASGATDAEKDKFVANVDTTNQIAVNGTKMIFDAPVHLLPGVEYAFVLLSNSPDYMIWHSEVGGDDVTTGAGGKRITKNPYTGVALKSANASTWTPDQNKDIKFNMNYMQFFEPTASTPETSKTLSVGPDETSTGFGEYNTIFPTGTSFSNPVLVDSIVLNANSVIVPDSNIAYSLEIKDGVSAAVEYPVAPGQVLELPETISFNGNTTNTYIKLKTTFHTENKDITPMVDVTRLSLTCFKNNINGGAAIDAEGDTSGAELRETHGSAEARYLTKGVVLDNAASQLDVFLDVLRPLPRTDIDVYARFDDATGAAAYTKLEGQVPVGDDFREAHFRTPADSDNERQFSKFQIKIVMKAVDDGSVAKINSAGNAYETGTSGVSANSAEVPEIRNLRGIATA